MWDLVSSYESFLPYLALVVFLTVMSVWEGARAKSKAKRGIRGQQHHGAAPPGDGSRDRGGQTRDSRGGTGGIRPGWSLPP